MPLSGCTTGTWEVGILVAVRQAGGNRISRHPTGREANREVWTSEVV
jgi:hypothetical protein